jgi:hypothetical protein
MKTEDDTEMVEDTEERKPQRHRDTEKTKRSNAEPRPSLAARRELRPGNRRVDADPFGGRFAAPPNGGVSVPLCLCVSVASFLCVLVPLCVAR